MQISVKGVFLVATVAVVCVIAFSGGGALPVAEASTGFSTAAAAQSFSDTGDMTHGTDFAAVAGTTMRTGEGVKLFRTYSGCSVGCSRGCSFGCSSGCSFGCKP